MTDWVQPGRWLGAWRRSAGVCQRQADPVRRGGGACLIKMTWASGSPPPPCTPTGHMGISLGRGQDNCHIPLCIPEPKTPCQVLRECPTEREVADKCTAQRTRQGNGTLADDSRSSGSCTSYRAAIGDAGERGRILRPLDAWKLLVDVEITSAAPPCSDTWHARAREQTNKSTEAQQQRQAATPDSIEASS